MKALHGNIMEAYLDWCEHVRLPARVPGVQYSSLTSNTRAPVGQHFLQKNCQSEACF